jgi:RecJ-like exonuclease
MWQQCPICNGKGYTDDSLSSTSSVVCTVCKGEKIINQLTGLPPSNCKYVDNNEEKNFQAGDNVSFILSGYKKVNGTIDAVDSLSKTALVMYYNFPENRIRRKWIYFLKLTKIN